MSHRNDAADYSADLDAVLALCRTLGLAPSLALRELRVRLEERRDFIAIPHPRWHRHHADLTLRTMILIYGNEEVARAKFRAMQLLMSRSGERVEDRTARTRWRDYQFEIRPLQSCPYCHVQLSATITQVDHIIPLARGGSDLPENWQLVCSI